MALNAPISPAPPPAQALRRKGCGKDEKGKFPAELARSVLCGAPTLGARTCLQPMRLFPLTALMLIACVRTDEGRIDSAAASSVGSAEQAPARPLDPVFSGTLTYPRTVIPLSAGRKLIHEAGGLDSDESSRGRPEAAKVPSKWTMHLPTQSTPFVYAASDLTDPKYSGEFEDYLRKYDRVSVFESDSGNAVVIVEDRSPHYPNEDHFALWKLPDGTWGSRKLEIDLIRLSDNTFHDVAFPRIVDLQDHGLRYTATEGTRWVDF